MTVVEQQDPVSNLKSLPPASKPNRKLRMWLAFAIVVLQLGIMYGPGTFAQITTAPAGNENNGLVESSIVDNPQVVLNSKLLGPLVGTLLLLIWWVVFSGASWKSRLIGPVLITGIGWVTWQLMHSTMLFAFVMFIVPSATTACVLTLFFCRNVRYPRRCVIALGVLSLVCGIWTMIRMDGVDGDLNAEFNWRWARTAEQKFLSTQAKLPLVESNTVAKATLDIQPSDWPEFRGSRRDGIIRNTRIKTDWSGGLPELWRRRIGPGWSSFSVVGDTIFTQEQRGEFEVVAAYDSQTGAEIWVQKNKTRFKESISGVGPRATPTFADGCLFSTGANGAVHCLDPTSGDVIWCRDMIKDTAAPVPMWGFSSSPLVYEGVVVVFAGGSGAKSLIAYDALTGEIRWTAGKGYMSYSSVHLANLHGVPQILLMTEVGLASFKPDSGEQLWLHAWPLGGGSARIIQPAIFGNDILIGTGYGLGTRRISVEFNDGQWSPKEIWTSHALKPYFNDFVIEGNFVFGFDKNIFTCIDLETGKRMWKRGRYGHGQVLLVADQKLLIVLAEKGDLVLLEANSKRHTELHRFKAVQGKSWNHPVIANGKLFVRNGIEAVCFDLSPQSVEE